MKTPKAVAAGVVATVLLVLVLFEIRQRRAVEEELARVKAQLNAQKVRTQGSEERTASAQNENAKSANRVAPNVQTASTVSSESQKVNATTPPSFGANSEEVNSPRMVAIANVGNASVGDAISTAQWAMVEGRPEVLAKCIDLDGESRGEVQAFLSKLSEEQRVRYPTPEALIAVLMCRDDGLKVISSVAILSQSKSDDEHSVVKIWGQDPAGKMLEGSFQMYRSPTGWQWSLPSTTIKRSLSMLVREVSKN